MARDFSGSTQYLSATAGADTQLLGDMSAVFTVVTDTTGVGFSTIACNQDSVGLDTEDKNACWYFGRSGNQWAAFHENGAGSNNTITLTSPTITAGVEYRVCVRRDVSAGTYQWTINGTTYTAVSSGYDFDPTGATATDIVIGAANVGSAQAWNGRIEEVAIYDSHISQEEAEAYTNGAAPLLVHPSSLAAYWPLRGTASTEPDIIGGNVLTVTGASAFAQTRHVYPESLIFSGQPGTAAPALSTIDALWCGAVTATTASVKAVLSDAETTARIEVDNNSDFSSPTYTSGDTATATTAGAGELIAFTATGLTADTVYYYRITVGGTPLATSGQFRTAPVAGTAKSFTIAVGGCSHPTLYTQPNSGVYDEIAASGAAFLLHLGDLHYGDATSSTSQATHRANILDHLTIAKVKGMYESIPIAYTYDDHDSGPNDNTMATTGWGTISDRVTTAYRDLVPHYPMAQPSGGLPHVQGISQVFDWGRVRVILPDQRAFASSGNTLLGDGGTYNSLVTWDGEAWMESVVDDAVTDGIGLVILAAARGWKHGSIALGGWSELWSTYQKALCDRFCDNGLQVLVVNGDWHFSAADDGSEEDFTTGKGFIPHLVCGALNGNSLTGPLGGAGPFRWDGVTATQPATNSTINNQYTLLSITDTGTDIDWSAEVFNESGTSVFGPVASSDVTPELNFTSATATVSEADGTVDVVVEKDWFSGCSCSYTTANGTATAGTDYTATSGTLSLPGVGKLKTISVPVTNRGGTQGDRTFSITISSPSGATVGSTNVVTVTIEDAAGGGATGIVRQQINAIEHGFSGASVSQLGGVLVQ